MKFTEFEYNLLLKKMYTKKTLDAEVDRMTERGISRHDAIRTLFHDYVARLCNVPAMLPDNEDSMQAMRYRQ